VAWPSLGIGMLHHARYMREESVGKGFEGTPHSKGPHNSRLFVAQNVFLCLNPCQRDTILSPHLTTADFIKGHTPLVDFFRRLLEF
jgi:hypothetical protein